MKLIPMTDFVFHLRNMTTSELCKTYPNSFKMPVWNGNQPDMVKDMLAIDAIQWKLTGEYAKFLKQSLELWMFVPCDEEGNVLQEPEKYMYLQNIGSMNTYATEDECIACEKYHKAKERVLFEGFELKEKYRDGAMYLNDWLVYNGVLHVEYDYKAPKPLNKNTEHLLDIDNINEITLTPTAIKQIGL